MDTAQHIKTAPGRPEDARDLQARLYREIGISAVAAALRFTTQPEPGKAKSEAGELPAFMQEHDSIAA